MIKKNTKVIFQDEGAHKEEGWGGGVPLSKGEIVHMHQEDGSVIDYEAVDKQVDCERQEDDQIIDITYTLAKK